MILNSLVIYNLVCHLNTQQQNRQNRHDFEQLVNKTKTRHQGKSYLLWSMGLVCWLHLACVLVLLLLPVVIQMGSFSLRVMAQRETVALC